MNRRMARTAVRLGWGAVMPGLLVGVALSCRAQQEPAEPLPRILVNVTGSNIPRTDIETALPVQRITREDIERSGATTPAEVLNTVSANLTGQTDAISISNSNPGLASANLRGLGGGSTLVLINGRRLANYAFDGGAVDLNSIPLAAIDRVEVLKDGASAIYGADAMAGVINFILRKDYAGFSATAYTGDTQHGGGKLQQATMTAGYGNLATDRFNAFVTVDWQKSDGLAASARPFARTVYLPNDGINKLSSQTFPANFRSSGVNYNPTRDAGCAPPVSIPLSPTSTRCGFDYLSIIDILPPVERTGVVAGATWQVNAENQVFATYLYGKNDFTLSLAPTPASQNVTFNGDPVIYPAGGPFYPTQFAAANGISGPLNLFYRTVPLGPRVDNVETQAQQVTVGGEGRVAGWNYNVAYIYSNNHETDSFQSGWVSESKFLAAMATGRINPFGPSGPDGDALLASTQVTGPVRSARGTTQAVEARASNEVLELPSGPMAMAVGVELRRESFTDEAAAAYAAGEILGASQLGSKSASRTVAALYAELGVPVVENVEAQIAVRDDHYSDFGNTINPKIAIRWQPLRSLLLRSSWGTGFRAPTLYDLNTPLSRGQTGNAFDDPMRCPTTQSPDDCNINFRLLTGGNPNLQPEKSQQFNAGVVWSPLNGLALGADYWNITKTGTIGLLTSDAIFANYDRYGATNIVRGPVDPAYPHLPGPIEYVLGLTSNLGDLNTSGIDVDLSFRGPTTAFGKFGFNLNGTYIIDWQAQLDGINSASGVGGNVDPIGVGAVPRWRHYATLTWNNGPWGATLAQNFTLGYTDANLDPSGNARRVGPYEIWNLQGTCTCFKDTAIVVGVKNLFDRSPPFSNQTAYTQVGYNPQYADPLGRFFYASLTFSFK